MLRGEQVAQERNVAEERHAIHSISHGGLNQASEHAYFTFLQANVMLNLALAESGFAHTCDGDRRAQRRNLDRSVDRNFAISEQVWRELQFHAHVLELKLRAGQQATRRSGSAERGQKTARGVRNALADAKLGDLPIRGADLWVLENMAAGIVQYRVRNSAGYNEGVVTDAKRVRADASRRGSR